MVDVARAHPVLATFTVAYLFGFLAVGVLADLAGALGGGVARHPARSGSSR